MLKIFLAPDRFAHYRYSVFNEIAKKFRLEIYAPKVKDLSGIEIANVNTEDSNFKWNNVKSFFLMGACFWQSGLIRAAAFNDYDVYIFWGDSWRISTWVSAVICRVLGKPVVFWTHGLYGNEGKVRLLYRVCFYKLADSILLYGNHARDELIKQGFNKDNLFVINNSLDVAVQENIYQKKSEKNKKIQRSFVFIGRLEPNKQLDFLIKATAKINKELTESEKIHLFIIGDGSQTLLLKELSKTLNALNYITFLGSSYDQDFIASVVMSSSICISPGNIGLAAMQSLIYGTPVITHDDPTRQGPEYESVIEGVSGTLYKYGSESSLIEAIHRCFLYLKEGVITENSCRNVIINNYTPDYQVKVFSRMIEELNV